MIQEEIRSPIFLKERSGFLWHCYYVIYKKLHQFISIVASRVALQVTKVPVEVDLRSNKWVVQENKRTGTLCACQGSHRNIATHDIPHQSTSSPNESPSIFSWERSCQPGPATDPPKLFLTPIKEAKNTPKRKSNNNNFKKIVI